jgi:hypothetical protein
LIGFGLALVAAGLALMHDVTAGSRWTAMLPGLIVAGVGIGNANPALAAAALRVVDPARSGMASGINNTFRLGGVAMGVATLGALLQSRVGHTLGLGRTLAAEVSSAGVRAVAGRPSLVHAATHAFVAGLRDLLLVGCALLLVGSLAAFTLLRVPVRTPEAEAATEPLG